MTARHLAWLVWAALGAGCRSSAAPVPPKAAAPAHAPVVYQVFSRSYADSNGDGAGDLDGVTAHLDHIQHAVGADALWLTPIHPSPSPHGYDVTDFRAVHPALGGMDAFRRLVAAAHARGMQVVMDLVLNHTSVEHPWFQARPDWYLWRTDDPGWKAPWPGGGRTWHPRPGNGFFYGLFWEGMPDLNWTQPAVEAEMLEVARHWLAEGVDGFRVDAARYLVESNDGALADLALTHAAERRLMTALERVRPDVWLVAEAWTARAAARTYAAQNGGGFQRVFDFDLAAAVEASLNGEKPGPLRAALEEARGDWPFAATFVGNHDVRRLASRLFARAEAVRSAYTVLLTLPGRPFLYGGDEVGLPQAEAQGDPGQRQPMDWAWADAQQKDPGSLLRHIRRLTALRARHPALQEDGPMVLLGRAADEAVVWARGDGAQRWVTVLNPTDHDVVVHVDLEGPCHTVAAALEDGPDGACAAGGLKLGSVRALQARVFRVH